MIAEYTIGLMIVVFLLGYIIGDTHGRRIERTRARMRMRRNFLIGGMRNW